MSAMVFPLTFNFKTLIVPRSGVSRQEALGARHTLQHHSYTLSHSNTHGA